MNDALLLPPPGQGVQSALMVHYAGVRERLSGAVARKAPVVIQPSPAPVPLVPVSEGYVPVNLLAPPSYKVILKLVALRRGMSDSDLIGRSRRAGVTAARAHAMALVQSHLRLSTPQIAKLFGNRDHTTVLYGIRKHMDAAGAGAEPAAFGWTAERTEQATRMLLDDVPLRDIWRHFGISRRELRRCPGYAATMRQRDRQHRRVEAAASRAIERELEEASAARPGVRQPLEGAA